MTVLYHPEFPEDVLRIEGHYTGISVALGMRFRAKVLEAIEEVQSRPNSAGHFLNTGSKVIPTLRRKNMKVFPYFLLYGVTADTLVFGSLIASASDPLFWLTRFPEAG